MGNKLVYAAPPPSQPPLQPNLPSGILPPPLTAPAPPPAQQSNNETPSISSETAKTSEVESSDKLTNPGVFEDLHKKCKELFPTPFDGFRLSVNKGLSNHFQVSHTLNLTSAPQGSSYHFGATYVGGKQTTPTESYPVILGDIDNSGSLSAQIIHQFSKRIRGKCVVQTQQKEFAMVQMDADYRGDDFTAVCTLGNLDILNESGIIVNHYLQRLTKRLDIGAELLYHYGQGQESAVLSLAGKYTGDNWIAAAQVNPAGWHASYYHKGNDNVSVGVDYEYSSRLQDSCVTVGYQIDIPKANVTVRGMADTNWTVAAVLEKKLLPLPFSFILSGMVNHQKNQSRFGFALQIG